MPMAVGAPLALVAATLPMALVLAMTSLAWPAHARRANTGCTDKVALNFDSRADVDDGNCDYGPCTVAGVNAASGFGIRGPAAAVFTSHLDQAMNASIAVLMRKDLSSVVDATTACYNARPATFTNISVCALRNLNATAQARATLR